MQTRKQAEDQLYDTILSVQAKLGQISLRYMDEKPFDQLAKHIAQLKSIRDARNFNKIAEAYSALLNTCKSNDRLMKKCKLPVKMLYDAIVKYQNDITKTKTFEKRAKYASSKKSKITDIQKSTLKFDQAIVITNIIARDKELKYEDRITKLVRNKLIYDLLLEEGKVTGKANLITFFRDYAEYQQHPTKVNFNKIKKSILADENFSKTLPRELQKELLNLGHNYKQKTFSPVLAKVAAHIAKELKSNSITEKRERLLLHERQQFSNIVTQISALKEQVIDDFVAAFSKVSKMMHIAKQHASVNISATAMDPLIQNLDSLLKKRDIDKLKNINELYTKMLQVCTADQNLMREYKSVLIKFEETLKAYNDNEKIQGNIEKLNERIYKKTQPVESQETHLPKKKTSPFNFFKTCLPGKSKKKKKDLSIKLK